LRGQLSKAERRLAQTEVALEIMGKHTRSWRRSPRARRTTSRPSGADGSVSGADRGRPHDPGRGRVDGCRVRPPGDPCRRWGGDGSGGAGQPAHPGRTGPRSGRPGIRPGPVPS
jgi:hypothetical protein